ncbi:hypothetical protein ATKI12_5242 [Kitasatospora sp. Ki12]|uniref:hypothetical protein n=1 Tax=Kitasatospora xanthocidica TaxID=83382 RepID=UPI00167A577C|nr:hypothetical protein [Kitasatospora xanthocidica]GHF69700.1 transporter [Kitasatospora xanthocidica]
MSAPTTTPPPASPAATATRPAPAPRGQLWRGILWLTWRQHRWQLIGGAVLTAGFLGWMAVNAADLQGALDLCHGPDCSRAVAEDRLARIRHGADIAGYQLNLVVFLPAMLGMFIGVPLLAREYEQRTLLLAWSQDISPRRWLFGKLAVLGTVVGGLAAALATECLHVARLVHLADRRSLFEGTLFQAGGWMPLTLALAWGMFGVAVGGALRRLVPAFLVVLGSFAGRTALMERLRPHLMDPVTRTIPLPPGGGAGGGGGVDAFAPVANDLVLDGGKAPFVDAAGGLHPYNEVMGQWCGNIPDGRAEAFSSCLRQHGLTGMQQSLQPEGRMGTFHLIENGLNLGLFVVALVVTWWLVRRARTTV